jgi:hypothetical protein
MDRRLFLIGALALAGCATTPAAVGPLAELEPVYAATAGREALTLQVASSGCTTKADFAFYVERRDGTVTLAFGRRRLDTCKSFAMGRTDLTFTWAELGVDEATPVYLLNPLIAWTGP